MWIESLFWLCACSLLISIGLYTRFLWVVQGFGWSSTASDWDGIDETLSVIIPARNEEVDLADGLSSVLGQEGVHLKEVIVVNDHSTDRTGQIANEFARSDPRVQVIHNPPLPPGWLGKPNAMHQALALATADWILLTDADIIHAPHCFAAGSAQARDGELDFFTMFPRVICQRFWENILVPGMISGLTMLCSPRKFDDPKSREAIGAGAFFLVKRSVLKSVGGLESIRSEMLDDVELARHLKHRGFRGRFRLAPHLGTVRLFKGSRDAFWGMTKNVLGMFKGRTWLAILAIIGTFMIVWTPLIAFIVGVVTSHFLLTIAGTVVYLVQYFGLLLSRKLFEFDPLKLFCFPLIAIVIAACTLRALYYLKIRRSVIWREREVRIS